MITDINLNPTHLLSPFITLGGSEDQEHAKDSVKYQRENPYVKKKCEIPSTRDNSKDLDELYTSERYDCEGMTVAHYQCLLCVYEKLSDVAVECGREHNIAIVA